MKPKAVLIGVVVAALISAARAAPDSPETRPRTAAAKAALRKYDKAIEKAQQDYARDAGIARKAAAAELATALKAATRAADLEEANRIKAAIDGLKADGETGAGKFPRGKWEATFLNGNRHLYEFDGQGGVRSTFDGRVLVGKLRREDANLVTVFDATGDLQRFSFAGDRLFVEHFGVKTSYSDTRAVDIAAGLPVKTAK